MNKIVKKVIVSFCAVSAIALVVGSQAHKCCVNGPARKCCVNIPPAS